MSDQERGHGSVPDAPPPADASFDVQQAYYQGVAERLYQANSPDFDEWVEMYGFEDLRAKGNRRLEGTKRTGPQATGYNILQHASDMPLASDERLIVDPAQLVLWRVLWRRLLTGTPPHPIDAQPDG